MAVTTEISWGDGSGDKIYLTRDASDGDQVVQVSSDANTGNARSKVVTFTSGVGNIQRQLTINQAGIPQEHTITLHPTSYDNDYSWYSQSNINNALSDADSTTYAQINYTRGRGAETYVYFKFDTSSIPSGATIAEVSCVVKCMTNGNSTLLPTREVQMFTGTTAKGNASSMPTSVETRTFSGVAWTLAELMDARVKVHAVRGTAQVNTNYFCRIYGATLTIKYIA